VLNQLQSSFDTPKSNFMQGILEPNEIHGRKQMIMKFNNAVARNNIKEPINDQVRMDLYDAEKKIAQVRSNRKKILEKRM